MARRRAMFSSFPTMRACSRHLFYAFGQPALARNSDSRMHMASVDENSSIWCDDIEVV